jgi:XTP/dITP diphosphohydrolase
MAATQRLLLATTSSDKIRELRGLLACLAFELLTPPDLGLALDVEEHGATFRENAEIKARAYHAATGLLTLAEDAGLEVDALDGAPGVRSARWEGDDYRHKSRLLIRLLEGRQGRERACRYVSELALVDPHGRLHHARGSVTGRVAHEPRGSGGFGYDPVFYLPRMRRTMAELTDEQKNQLSHRGRAVRRLLPTLRRILEADPSRPV